MIKPKVGYRSPPISGQFKKGKSGNPSGRPKRKDLLLAAEIEAVLQYPVEFFEKGRRKSAPNNELLVRRLIQLAIKGHTRGAELLVEMHTQGRASSSNGRIQIVVEGWLESYAGQTGEQKTQQHRAEAENKRKMNSQAASPKVIRSDGDDNE